MIFNLRDATENDLDLTYKIKKNALQEYLEILWGWNEEAQADFHREHYQKSRFQLIESQNKTIGYLEIERYEDYIFLANLMISRPLQSQGIGKMVMQDLIKNNPNIQLEVLKVNQLYEALGFGFMEESEFNFRMKLGI